jgi:hypothetical protein
MAVRVAVHQPSPDSTWDNWLDSTPDLSSVNSTQAHRVDVEHQPTDLAVGVRIAAWTGSSSTGWDNHCNYEPASVHWANPSGAKQSRRRWATEQQGDRERSRIATAASSAACRRTGVATTLVGARPCRRTPPLVGCLRPFTTAARAGRALLQPFPVCTDRSAACLVGPPVRRLVSEVEEVRRDRRATPPAEHPSPQPAGQRRGVPACAGVRDRPIAA